MTKLLDRVEVGELVIALVEARKTLNGEAKRIVTIRRANPSKGIEEMNYGNALFISVEEARDVITGLIEIIG